MAGLLALARRLPQTLRRQEQRVWLPNELTGQASPWLIAGKTMGIIGLEILAGLVLSSFALPAAVQPVHLTLATLLFGVQFLTLLAVARARKTPQTMALTDAAPQVVA